MEYGYCEIRGLDDVELNVKKTAEFLLLQKWVSVGTVCSPHVLFMSLHVQSSNEFNNVLFYCCLPCSCYVNKTSFTREVLCRGGLHEE